MTERAKRAAEELRRRGWQIDGPDSADNLDRECQRCGQQISHDARYCQHCGAPVVAGIAEGSIADIEAAIAAALEETP